MDLIEALECAWESAAMPLGEEADDLIREHIEQLKQQYAEPVKLDESPHQSTWLVFIDKDTTLSQLLFKTQCASAGGQVRRLLYQGQVKLNGKVVKDQHMLLSLGTYALQVGRHRFISATLIQGGSDVK